jgi:hypothetical protein
MSAGTHPIRAFLGIGRREVGTKVRDRGVRPEEEIGPRIFAKKRGRRGTQSNHLAYIVAGRTRFSIGVARLPKELFDDDDVFP